MGRMVLGFLLAVLMANPFCCCIAAGGCGAGASVNADSPVCPHCRTSEATTGEQLADDSGRSPDDRMPALPDCPNCPNRMQKKAADAEHALAGVLSAPVRDLNFQDSDWGHSSLLRRPLADGPDVRRPGLGWLQIQASLSPSPRVYCVFRL